MAPCQLHLNVNTLNAGVYSSAWRAPSSDPRAYADMAHYVKVARIAERGTFDAIFLADVPAFSDRPDLRPFQTLEPTIVLAHAAAATEHLGLIASTSYNDPYNLARRFASLDLDGPLPEVARPVDGMQTFFDALVGAADREKLTVRQLIHRFGGSTGHRVIVGTPEAIADDIAAWFTAGAVDGFNLMPDVLPEGLEIFVDHVVPLLRQRGCSAPIIPAGRCGSISACPALPAASPPARRSPHRASRPATELPF